MLLRNVRKESRTSRNLHLTSAWRHIWQILCRIWRAFPQWCLSWILSSLSGTSIFSLRPGPNFIAADKNQRENKIIIAELSLLNTLSNKAAGCFVCKRRSGRFVSFSFLSAPFPIDRPRFVRYAFTLQLMNTVVISLNSYHTYVIRVVTILVLELMKRDIWRRSPFRVPVTSASELSEIIS